MMPAVKDMANVEAEAVLLGALMINNGMIDAVADMLCAEDFFDVLLGEIFSVIVREYSLGRPANPVTIKPYFEGHSGFAQLGGMKFLAELTGNSAVLVGAMGFANQVREMSKRRRMIEGLQEALSLANDLNATNLEVSAAADNATNDNDDEAGIVEVSLIGCMDGLIDNLGKQETGVRSTIIPTFDSLVGDLRPKQLTILAGRPGMGKTACALSYALGAAQGGYGVLFVSLEMSGYELAARIAADVCFDGEGGVPYDMIRDGKTDNQQSRKIVQARMDMEDWPIQIIDASRMTVGNLNRRVKRWKRRMAATGQSLDLVVVDYLQLMSPDSKTKSFYEAVSEVSRGLKAIAKEHSVSVMALAQLSREAEKRGDKRPQLSDLRDSGQIEQDADAVMFLLRDEYYLRQNEPEQGTSERIDWETSLQEALNKIEFICAKRRNGKTGSGRGEFHGKFQAVRG